MKIQDQLKDLLDETPEINLVAFGDLSSGLILNWSARAHCPREVLDLLGEKAVTSFAMLAPLRPGATAEAGLTAIHFTATGAQVFARDAASPDDVVCAVCEPGASLEPLLRSTRLLAEKIAGAP